MITTESTCQDWRNPPDLFEKLNEIYNFDCDVCASDENHLCDKYFTKERSALDPGAVWGERCFMNPPYGKELKHFVKAARDYVRRNTTSIVVCLIPARTSAHWFHDLVFDSACGLTFIDGRLKFSGNKHVAPFASCIIEYRWNERTGMNLGLDLGRTVWMVDL